jgi:hypothetical protein
MPILTAFDLFQIEDRGSVVTGKIGEAWENAKVGDVVVLHTPAGAQTIATIKDRELLRPPIWKDTSDEGALLFTDRIEKERAPEGTVVVPQGSPAAEP